MSISDQDRQEIKERANFRCEYCLKPDAYGGRKPHVDHVLPKKHGGDDKLDNLAWACFQCNSYKGPIVSSYDEIGGELTPLFNPRTQTWSEHFELIDDHIAGKTATGRVTIRILKMNNEHQVNIRKILIEANLW